MMTGANQTVWRRAGRIGMLMAVAGAAACGDQILALPGIREVTIRDNQFAPNIISVGRGSTVGWTNTGANTHTSVSNDGHWSSGSLAPGETFSHTFRSAGTFAYRCSLHAGMNGTVIVE